MGASQGLRFFTFEKILLHRRIFRQFEFPLEIFTSRTLLCVPIHTVVVVYTCYIFCVVQVGYIIIIIMSIKKKRKKNINFLQNALIMLFINLYISMAVNSGFIYKQILLL